MKKRKLSDKELARRVKLLEAAFRRSGKPVYVIYQSELLDFAKQHSLVVKDMSGNGRDMFFRPAHI